MGRSDSGPTTGGKVGGVVAVHLNRVTFTGGHLYQRELTTWLRSLAHVAWGPATSAERARDVETAVRAHGEYIAATCGCGIWNVGGREVLGSFSCLYTQTSDNGNCPAVQMSLGRN